MFLLEKPFGRQGSVAHHPDDRYDLRRGCPGNRRAFRTGQHTKLVRPHKLLVHKSAILNPLGGDVHEDHVVRHWWLGVYQNFTSAIAELPTFSAR